MPAKQKPVKKEVMKPRSEIETLRQIAARQPAQDELVAAYEALAKEYETAIERRDALNGECEDIESIIATVKSEIREIS